MFRHNNIIGMCGKSYLKTSRTVPSTPHDVPAANVLGTKLNIYERKNLIGKNPYSWIWMVAGQVIQIQNLKEIPRFLPQKLE